MNALELANELDETEPYVSKDQYVLTAAATMLRQQQAEIEALKDEMAGWKESYENCHRTCNGYGMN
jgi:hypothetical protein